MIGRRNVYVTHLDSFLCPFRSPTTCSSWKGRFNVVMNSNQMDGHSSILSSALGMFRGAAGEEHSLLSKENAMPRNLRHAKGAHQRSSLWQGTHCPNCSVFCWPGLEAACQELCLQSQNCQCHPSRQLHCHGEGTSPDGTGVWPPFCILRAGRRGGLTAPGSLSPKHLLVTWPPLPKAGSSCWVEKRRGRAGSETGRCFGSLSPEEFCLKTSPLGTSCFSFLYFIWDLQWRKETHVSKE